MRNNPKIITAQMWRERCNKNSFLLYVFLDLNKMQLFPDKKFIDLQEQNIFCNFECWYLRFENVTVLKAFYEEFCRNFFDIIECLGDAQQHVSDGSACNGNNYSIGNQCDCMPALWVVQGFETDPEIVFLHSSIFYHLFLWVDKIKYWCYSPCSESFPAD